MTKKSLLKKIYRFRRSQKKSNLYDQKADLSIRQMEISNDVTSILALYNEIILEPYLSESVKINVIDDTPAIEVPVFIIIKTQNSTHKFLPNTYLKYIKKFSKILCLL